jgi:hypothetical protein
MAGSMTKRSSVILGIRRDYKVYLRHHTEGWSGTVMYFVPDKAEAWEVKK